ncbi:WPP domain-associated protein [Lolium perenne]|uniref:WPP domain-associated protein n=1 Tax=Lolium perenne TaxID=4522 RepID=UPI0021F57768|nr:WPP domain-associated protein-like [Lolium perenne]
MEAIQPASDPITKVLSDRMNPLLNGSTIPDGWSVTSEDSLTPRLLSFKSNSSTESYFGGSGRALSQSNRHVSAPNAENNYMEYLDLMKLEVDSQLDKLKGDVTGLENYALPDSVYIIGTHLGMSLDVMLIEIDERFNALKLLLGVVFRQAREMVDLSNPSVSDLQWEHELQLEIISITIGECITGLQEELERKLYEQISVTNTMSKNWQEAVAQFAAMREDLSALSKLLFPSVPESHISHSKSEGSGRSSRWKYNIFGKKTKEDHASSRTEGSKSFRKQKSMVISEKSDFRHLNAMTKEETISYFKSEISKLKRVHESALLEKTEEIFKLKREKGSVALQNDVEFEPLRKKIPQIIARMDQIISKNIKAPGFCTTHHELDEKSRFSSRIDSLYYDNQHLRGLLADNMKDVKELSSQLSEASRDMSLQLSSEEELLRQIEKYKEEWEDLRIESDVRDGLYCTVTRSLLDDSMNNMHDAALSFDAKLSSLEAVISENEKALRSSNDENWKLREKITELEEEKECLFQEHQDDSEVIKQESAVSFDAKLSSLEAVISEKENALRLSKEENRKLNEKLAGLEKDCLFQEHQEDPEIIKQESAEMILRDIEVEPQTSPGRSHETPKQDLQYDELLKLNGSNMDYDGALTKNGQEKQLECILVSIMKLSKEFVQIEQKISTERTENRSEDLSDHCSHMVKQAVVLTKVGLWYKQMLEERRSELQKAEAKVVILGDKVNSHLSLLEKIYVTLDHYSPTLQKHPGLLDAFLKTCKLVAGLRSRHDEDETT